MRVLLVLVCVASSWASSYPNYYGPPPVSIHKAVQQAHSLQLIPVNSVVDKTAASIQVAAYSVGPDDRTNLQAALGPLIPWDVLKSLEKQVDSIGGATHPQQRMRQPPPPSQQVPHYYY